MCGGMTKSGDTSKTSQNKTQDSVAVFQLEKADIRGRAVQVGPALDKALGERYPEQVARLLGEAMMIAAIVARALKFEGRLIVQCHGTNEGAVSLLAADCNSSGHIRGYARWDEGQLKMINLDNCNPGAKDLLGGGTFSMTIDQGPDMDQYQGLAAIEGASLAACAEHYFAQSEQIPTRLKLACGLVQIPGHAPRWSGGGILIQRIAGDQARGGTEEDWTTAKALFDTISDDELMDPDLSQATLLYRLFHEDGVRLIDTSPVVAQCSCSEDRLRATLKSFDKAALTDMAEAGNIVANCEFCGVDYTFSLTALDI